MAGWDLKSGKYDERNLSNDEIMAVINYCFSTKTQKTTSYKYAFFKSMLDNLFNVDDKLILTFDKIFSRFTEIYWALVFKHRLYQIQITTRWKQSSVEKIINSFIEKHNFTTFFEFEKLNENLQLELTKNIGNECKKYVVGAFYEDSQYIFYSFDKAQNYLQFNPLVYEVLLKYKFVFEKINYFEWIKFLERVNPEEKVFAIASKLDASTKRSSLVKYRDYFFDYYNDDTQCFYCDKKVSVSTVAIDHFVPWSFCKDDKLWNFVLSCPKCNSSKTDKLTTTYYLDNIISRNEIIVSVNKNKDFKSDLDTYKQKNLISMYETAIYNGFDNNWQPIIKR